MQRAWIALSYVILAVVLVACGDDGGRARRRRRGPCTSTSPWRTIASWPGSATAASALARISQCPDGVRVDAPSRRRTRMVSASASGSGIRRRRLSGRRRTRRTTSTGRTPRSTCSGWSSSVLLVYP